MLDDSLTSTDRIELPNGWYFKAYSDEMRVGKYMALCWPDGTELASLRITDAVAFAYAINRAASRRLESLWH